MEFQEIVMARYATKEFNGRPVPEDQVEALMDLIRHAPSSFNVQPWRALVIADAERKASLVEAAWGQKQITSCSHLFVFCANTDLEPLVDRLEARLLEAGTPEDQATGFTGMIRGFIANLDADQRLAWAQRQAYIALANGVNGTKSLGFDSCPMEGFMPDKFSEILGLPSTLIPTVLMPIGYAGDTPRPKLRFNQDEMFFTSPGA